MKRMLCLQATLNALGRERGREGEGEREIKEKGQCWRCCCTRLRQDQWQERAHHARAQPPILCAATMQEQRFVLSRAAFQIYEGCAFRADLFPVQRENILDLGRSYLLPARFHMLWARGKEKVKIRKNGAAFVLLFKFFSFLFFLSTFVY